MKRNLFFLVLTLVSLHLLAGNVVPSKIEAVTLYRNGAQIVRKTNVSLKQGENSLVLGNLPAGFDASTIRISFSGKVNITGVTYRDNHIQDFSVNPEYVVIQKQLKQLQEKVENEQIVYETWKEEEGLLLANKKLGNENSGVTAAQLTAVAEMYRVRLLEVKQKLLDSKRRQEENQKEIQRIQAQLNEWTRTNATKHSGEIIVECAALQAGESNLKLVYFDPRATWTTDFEARVNSLVSPLNLVHKAKINQYTGEDWKQVSLVLTTGDPSFNTTAPVLSPWFLHFNMPYNNYDYAKLGSAVQTRANARPTPELQEAAGDFVAANARENLIFTEYTLPDKTTIPADNNMHDVSLKAFDIPAKYRYMTIPKMDNKVYLMAEIVDWDQYNLSSGSIKLFVEDTYIGDTYLDISQLSDTLALSLGPDIAVAAKREKIKEYQKTSFLSSKKQIQSAYEISIKNNKTTAIEVTLTDQVPLATDANMEVEIDDLSGGSLNKETGIVEWKLTLKPGEQVKKKLAYKVKIPKDKSITL